MASHSDEFYIGSLNLSGFRVRPMSYEKTDYSILLTIDFGILTALSLIKLDILRGELIFLRRLNTSFYLSVRETIYRFYLKQGWRYAFEINAVNDCSIVRFHLDAGIYPNG